jgi:hypothetical protein
MSMLPKNEPSDHSNENDEFDINKEGKGGGAGVDKTSDNAEGSDGPKEL